MTDERHTHIHDSIEQTDPHSFQLSHAKNYFGIPLAVALGGLLEAGVPQNLVKMTREAALGAERFGLITRQQELTTAGEIYISEITNSTTTVESLFEAVCGSGHDRFVEIEIDGLRKPTQEVVARYPAVAQLIGVLDERGALSLSQLAEVTSGASGVLHDYITDGDSDAGVDTTEAFSSAITFQFKSILFHVGIVTTPGSDTTTLSPTDDVWELSPLLNEDVKRAALAADNGGEWL
jgi:hypothetical protein